MKSERPETSGVFDAEVRRNGKPVTELGVVQQVEEAVALGDTATMERVVNRSRWGMDEVQLVTNLDGNPATTEDVPSKPQVVTEYDGDQPRVVFKPGVDFTKGGSIPF